MLKKVAIISTWKENCGIAHYTSFLKKALDNDYAIDVFSLPKDIFSIQNPNKIEQHLAEDWINNICSQLHAYDFVNIQFEPGIFGTRLKEIFSRTKKIILHSKAVVLTFHSVFRLQGNSLSKTVRSNPNIFKTIPLWAVHTLRNRLIQHKWKQFYNFLHKQAQIKKITIVTHTKRDMTYLSARLPNIKIYDVPLIYLDQQTRDALPSLAASSKLGAKISMKAPTTRYIGVFGFIAEYKGFITAMQALAILDDSYELLVFGSLHERLLTYRMKMHPYVKELISYIEKFKKSNKKFSDRVHFMGNVPDDELLFGMMACDAVLFPYINSEQTASGPISLAIELDRYIIVSRNVTFLELAKYYPDKIEFCDIGNYYEIAKKVRDARSEISEEKEINGMRWVYFHKRGQSLYPETTLAVYKKSFGDQISNTSTC